MAEPHPHNKWHAHIMKKLAEPSTPEEHAQAENFMHISAMLSGRPMITERTAAMLPPGKISTTGGTPHRAHQETEVKPTMVMHRGTTGEPGAPRSTRIMRPAKRGEGRR